jgi:hypothetical protein
MDRDRNRRGAAVGLGSSPPGWRRSLHRENTSDVNACGLGPASIVSLPLYLGELPVDLCLQEADFAGLLPEGLSRIPSCDDRERASKPLAAALTHAVASMKEEYGGWPDCSFSGADQSIHLEQDG